MMIRLLTRAGLLIVFLIIFAENAFPGDDIKSPAIIGGKIWNKSDTLKPEIKGVEDTLQSNQSTMKDSLFTGYMVQLPADTISPETDFLKLKLTIPRSLKFIKDAPILLMAKSSDPDAIEIGKGEGTDPKKGFNFPLTVHKGSADLFLYYRVVCCTTGSDSACFFKEAKLEIPVTVGESDEDFLEIKYSVDD
jgi:hypothetical protein